MTQQQTITTAVVAIVALLVIGGGVALGAKNAEPGDMLYNLRASLYGDVSGDAQAQMHLQGAREAYDEAERMDDQGTLTATERARITADYTAHVSAVAGRIAALEAQGDLDAAASLRTELRAILRDFRDVFPDVIIDIGGASSSSSDMTSSSSESMTSDSMSSDGDDESSSSTSTSQGAASSIFVQPSSSVTSA